MSMSTRAFSALSEWSEYERPGKAWERDIAMASLHVNYLLAFCFAHPGCNTVPDDRSEEASGATPGVAEAR